MIVNIYEAVPAPTPAPPINEPLNAPLEWRAVTRGMCIKCMAGQYGEARKCEDAGCPLFPWRMQVAGPSNG